MSNCPKYRLRLFLSVDLVGSTAYKAGQGSEVTEKSALPRWVNETRHFYREFPLWLRSEFSRQAVAAQIPNERCPEIWKTVGDEIIFCVRLVNYHHLARCVDVFLKTLVLYSTYLEDEGIPLDVKGVGWTAAFPAPNITVAVDDKHKIRDGTESDLLTNESIEQDSDNSPTDFEYLGKEIDTGFRVAKHAGADRFALSLELAYLIAHGCAETICSFPLMYHGREAMKGVINGRPYPIITIDTERKTFRRKVRAYEQALTGEREIPAEILRGFLQAFMEDERVDAPILPMNGETIIDSAYPQVYRSFQLFWLDQNKEVSQRNKVEDQAGQQTGIVMPDDPSIIDPLSAEDNSESIKAYLREVGTRFKDI